MRMNRAWLSLFVMGCMVCTTAAMAEQTQIQVFDENGVQLVDYAGGLTSADGQLYQKLQPRPDGTWTVDVPANSKLTLHLWEQGGNNSFAVDFRIGAEVEDITTVQIPAQPGPAQAPVNDTCGGAVAVDIGGGAAGDTGQATFTGPYPFCDTSHTAPELWYSVVGDGTTLTATTCNTASYDTKITVYCLDCDPAGALCVAGNDDDFVGGCGLTSTVDWCSEAGSTYYIMVHGFSSNTGTFDLAVSSDGLACSGAISCVPPPPMGACCECDCFDPPRAACAVTTEDDCAGTWQGEDTECFLLDPPTTYGGPVVPPLAIPDGGPAISTDLVIPDIESCLVGDVNVELQITHTWVGDLLIDVTSPAGTTVLLWPGVCGSTDNFNATADDDGTATLCLDISLGPSNVVFYDPDVTGAPDAKLEVIEGEQSGGTWTLTIEDTFPADSGTLNFWALHISCATAVCLDSDCVAGPGDDEGDDESSDSGGSMDATTYFTIPEVDTPTQLLPRVGSSEPNGDDDRGARGRRVR